MKKIYQIKVVGVYANFDDEAIYYSKNVYMRHPTQEEIDAFVKRCCEPLNDYDLFNMNNSKPYKTTIIELDLVKD